jgi:hypothetical protein
VAVAPNSSVRKTRREVAIQRNPLLHIENFFHHSEPLAGLKTRHWLKILGHLRLPAQIHRIVGQCVPSRVKICDSHNQNQILLAAKDRIIRDANFLQLPRLAGASTRRSYRRFSAIHTWRSRKTLRSEDCTESETLN